MELGIVNHAGAKRGTGAVVLMVEQGSVQAELGEALVIRRLAKTETTV